MATQSDLGASENARLIKQLALELGFSFRQPLDHYEECS